MFVSSSSCSSVLQGARTGTIISLSTCAKPVAAGHRGHALHRLIRTQRTAANQLSHTASRVANMPMGRHQSRFLHRAFRAAFVVQVWIQHSTAQRWLSLVISQMIWSSSEAQPVLLSTVAPRLARMSRSSSRIRAAATAGSLRFILPVQTEIMSTEAHGRCCCQHSQQAVDIQYQRAVPTAKIALPLRLRLVSYSGTSGW